MEQKIYTDEEIVKMILQSDRQRKEALRHIYIQWRGNAQRIMMKSGASITDVEDAIQEAVIVFDNSIRHGKYKKMASLKNYFLGICKGRLYSNRRSTNRIDLTEKQQVMDGIDHQHPETLMLEAEERELLIKMLDMLDEKCREVLRLYRLSFSMKEIGHKIGVSSSSNVRQRVFQCRKKLKQIVAKNPLFTHYFSNLS